MMAPTVHADRSAKDLDESLLTMLTCRSCALYLSPPVHQCWKGHSFCSRCVSGCLKCPICDIKFIKTHNMSLEIITRYFLFPCKNRIVGCEAKLKLQELYQHEDICTLQKLHECAIGKYEDQGCSWRGPCSKMWLHVKETHPTKFFSCQNIECVIKEFDSVDSFSSVLLIRALGESFWYFSKQDKNKNKFLGAAQYIGSKHRALKYKFETEFCSSSLSDFKLSFSMVTHHYGKEIYDIFNSEQCMSLGSKMLNNFLKKDNSLHFNLRVKAV